MLYFDPTAINFTTMCFVALAIWTLTVVAARRTQHALPLVFYGLMWVFNRWFERGLNTDFIMAGVFLALAVRFEFLNNSAVKWLFYGQFLAICLIIWNCLIAVFGPALMPQFGFIRAW